MQPKNTINIRTFHRKLALRLGLVALVLAAVFGGYAWWSQRAKIIDTVTDRALQGTKLFNDQVNYLINTPGWQDAVTIERELKAFVGDTSRTIKDREGHFIFVSLFNPQFGLMASFTDEGYPLLEALKEEKEALIRKLQKAQNSLYQVYRLGDKPFILTATPLVDQTGAPVAFLAAIFAVAPEAVQAARANIKRTAMSVIGIVLLTTILLYPIIVMLTRRLGQMTLNLLDSNLETLEVLGSAIAKRDSDTDAHNYRVTIYAVRLAEAVDLDTQAIQSLIKGAFLHDVGKIGVRDNILLKPGRLDKDEFEVMKTHVRHGLDIVKRSAWLRDATDVVGHHHEKYNGQGYYQGLAGEEIPLGARIFAIADVFDALTSERPYKKPFSFEKTMEILEQDKGTHFDPTLVDAFGRIAPDLYKEFSGREDEALKDRLKAIRDKYYAEDAEIQIPQMGV
jgi:HD-GYP domain-containing protein (c-di-GMP phosphodiesterase class II)